MDTGHNFPEVIAYRDRVVAAGGLRLAVAKVQDWIDDGRLTERPDGTRNPLQTVPLVDTIAAEKFDAVIGGARRDEERARAKERIFSLRDAFGGWDPRRQRPELWELYNGRHAPGEHVRVFPLSNWTELDVWNYIEAENIDLPEIYYAHRAGCVPAQRHVADRRVSGAARRRARCWRTGGSATAPSATCPAPAPSTRSATDVRAVIEEIIATRITERGRHPGRRQAGEAAMEDRKREGYF